MNQTSTPVFRVAHAFEGSLADIRVIQTEFLHFFKGCRNVLDLGCGQGVFLDLLRETGSSGEGVEQDPEMVALAREKGLSVHLADLRSFLGHQGPAYDGIFASHIIEHFSGVEAMSILQRCQESLKPGGVIVVVTPNYGHPYVREENFWLDITHVRPYPLPLLVKMLEAVGLAVTQAGAISAGFNDLYVVATK